MTGVKISKIHFFPFFKLALFVRFDLLSQPCLIQNLKLNFKKNNCEPYEEKTQLPHQQNYPDRQKRKCKQKSKQRPSAIWWPNFATFFGSKLKVTLVLSSLKNSHIGPAKNHNGQT